MLVNDDDVAADAAKDNDANAAAPAAPGNDADIKLANAAAGLDDLPMPLKLDILFIPANVVDDIGKLVNVKPLPPPADNDDDDEDDDSDGAVTRLLLVDI